MAKDIPSLKSFKKNLETFALNVKFNSTPLIVASQPSLYSNNLTREDKKLLWMQKAFMKPTADTYADLNSLIMGMNEFNKVSKDISIEFQTGFVDLEKIVPKNSKFFKDDCHYTEMGNQLIADSLSSFIQKQSYISNQSE